MSLQCTQKEENFLPLSRRAGEGKDEGVCSENPLIPAFSPRGGEGDLFSKHGHARSPRPLASSKINRPKAVLQSSLLIIAGELTCRVIAFFSFILVARCLGVEALGQYSFVFSFLSFFDILAMFGMNSIVVREMAGSAEAAAKILKNAIFLRSLFLCAAIVTACIVASFLPIDLWLKGLVCLGSLGMLVAYRPIFEGIFRICLAMGIPVGTSVAKSLLFLALALTIALLRGGVVWFVLASVVANLAGAVALVCMAARKMKPSGPIDRTICRTLLWESLPMVFSGILTVLYIRVDVMMLTFMKGFQSVGFYSAATKLSEALVIVPAALMTTLFPILSQYARNNPARFKEVLAQGFIYLAAFIVPFVVLLRIYADPIVTLLFKSQYAASGQALSILVLSCMFVYPNVIMVNALIALRKQIFDTWFSLLSLAVNIILNLWWIPAFGFLGSACANVGSELVQFVCLAFYLARVHKVQIPWNRCLRLMGLGGAFYGLTVLASGVVPWAIAIPVFLCAYVPVLFVSGVLRTHDRRFLWDTVQSALRLREAQRA